MIEWFAFVLAGRSGYWKRVKESYGRRGQWGSSEHGTDEANSNWGPSAAAQVIKMGPVHNPELLLIMIRDVNTACRMRALG